MQALAAFLPLSLCLPRPQNHAIQVGGTVNYDQ
jgi:hypothetical protein